MRIKETISAAEVGKLEDVMPELNPIHQHQKLTMQKLVELKEKKVWDSIYIKCFMCGEFKPAKDGVLLESNPTFVNHKVEGTGVFGAIEQVCEVICSDCERVLP